MKPGWLAIGSGVAVGAACAALAAMPQIRSLEQRVGLPWLFQLRGPLEPPADIVLVLMNEQAAANMQLRGDAEGFHRCEELRIGQRSGTHVSLPAMPSRWPRCVHARLLARLAAVGAKLVVFDVLFRRRPPLPGAGGDLHAWQDEELASAASLVPVVVAQKVEVDGEHERLVELSPAIAAAALGSAPFPLVVESGRRVDRFLAFKEDGFVTPTLPAVALQARLLSDYAAWVKFVEQRSSEAATLLPTTAAELTAQRELQATMLLMRQMLRSESAFMAAMQRDASHGGRDPNVHGPETAVRVLAALYTGAGARFINFYGPAGSIPAVSYDVALGASVQELAARFKDRIVFVGYGETSRTEQVEHFATAFSSGADADLSGVEIAATAYANLLNDRTLRQLGLGYWLALTFACGFLAHLACARLGNRVAVVVVTLIAISLGAGSLYLFESQSLWVPLVVPLLFATPVGMVTAFGWKFWTAHQQRARLRHAFGHFVPRAVVDALEQNAAQLGSSQESIECGCVSTDAANFTPLAESMPPEELTRFLNRYFEALFGRVAEHGGLISDVMGDAMLAIWPHRSENTHHRLLRALLAMRDAAERFNEQLAGNRLGTRFGIDWGRVALSTVGAHGHYEYRAVGDAVNTATRIQELNKKLGTRVLLSHPATGDAANEFLLRDLGRFLLRGKSQPVHVHELMGVRANASSAELELCAAFDVTLRTLEAGDFAGALERFRRLRMSFPDDGPVKFFAEALATGRPRRDGAWVVT